ncbi:MAG: DedA family protein [Deltaproteobacteria bacterium]|nr:DedA family protein [Deltaproteobacteria bacterium]MCL5278139.1 DedA family protein [Deltaproteobacteria bacterium]
MELFLTSYAEHFTYAAIFVFLILCGLGFPVPEEVLLVISGYVAYKGITSLYVTGVVDFLGVIGGDLILFEIGRRWAKGIRDHAVIRRFIGDAGLEKVERFYASHGSKAIFIARFVSGLRIAVFLSAGIMGTRMKKFVSVDAAAGLISIPLWVGPAYVMGADFDLVLRYAKDFEYLFVLALPFVVALIVVSYLHSKGKTP